MTQHPLAGRVALVTGAGRGIGAAVSRHLAAAGASVVVNDLGAALDGSGVDLGPADDVVRDIVAAGGTAVADGADVADFDAVAAMVGRVVDRYGRLDIVVNVAGILRDRMIWNMTADEWQAVIAVHLTGTFNTTRHVAAHWRAVGDHDAARRIINVTSGSGLYGSTSQPNYAAAKMGIVGLTYSCANSLARTGATCNSVSPAADTRMTPRPVDAADEAAQQRRSPDNVATVVAWLASDEARWCTGQVIGAREFDVSLYALPRPVVQLTADGPWDAGVLATAAGEHLAPRVEKLPFPSWPPQPPAEEAIVRYRSAND
ncbi:SDR family oxidoreductase [Solwaraspora sp. WMMD1047]|uniref:SDR family NAD(P)-dependent oxidoreductase n=1 Tax=Solwaraspora sp. WMMD1047 TaxID=3016102 RepID=UPI00241679D9|nr:SDR family NAD(P)-dependent oxidoreductase [Solwaraspora sp. WMMD1047]MDG4834358.1 SDR family oxidoreductase [Solwaraspora sp. WMMD1047]